MSFGDREAINPDEVVTASLNRRKADRELDASIGRAWDIIADEADAIRALFRQDRPGDDDDPALDFIRQA